MTRLIFLGPPGAGKGTQAKALAHHCNIPHISTGDILRQAVRQGSQLGLKVREYMESGELVPDQLVQDLIPERLRQPDAKQGWILDGFPRNISQAEFLDELLAELGPDSVGQSSNQRVLNLDVPDEVVVVRLLGRAQKEGRKDDTEEAIRRRLEVYREETAPVIGYYSDRHQLVAIDGNQPMEKVTAELHKAIQSQALPFQECS